MGLYLPRTIVQGRLGMYRSVWMAAAAAVMFSGAAEAKPAPAAVPALQCPATLPAGLQCAAGANGVATSGSLEDANRFLSSIEDGAKRFEQHFQKKVSPAALVEPSGQFDAIRPALNTRVVFPWLKFQENIVDGTVAQIKAARPGLTEEQLAPIRASEFKKQQARELGAVSHEFCHLWLIYDFGFAPPPGASSRHYGGSAPDWLDETAAVLCENDILTNDRRAQMRALRKGTLAWKLFPLQDFTTMAHPLAQREQELLRAKAEGSDGNAPAKGEGYFKRLSGDEAKAFIGDTGAPAFYVQARVFADFLIEKSGRPEIFGSIARATAKRQSFAMWLAKNGKKANLPGTVGELQTQWDAWLDIKYPKA